MLKILYFDVGGANSATKPHERFKTEGYKHNMIIKLNKKLKCERCGHTWTPRKEDVRVCPFCRSSWWDRPRRTKTDDNSQKLNAEAPSKEEAPNTQNGNG